MIRNHIGNCFSCHKLRGELTDSNGVDLMLLKINFLRRGQLIWFSSIINNLNETVI